jgi:hypothetical protein
VTGTPEATGSGVGPEQRLVELGIALPDVVPPVASYVPAVRSGRYVYTSGQLPMSDGALLATGKVGEGDGLVDPERANALARTCALNALAAVRSLTGSLDGRGWGDLYRGTALQIPVPCLDRELMDPAAPSCDTYGGSGPMSSPGSSYNFPHEG